MSHGWSHPSHRSPKLERKLAGGWGTHTRTGPALESNNTIHMAVLGIVTHPKERDLADQGKSSRNLLSLEANAAGPKKLTSAFYDGHAFSEMSCKLMTGNGEGKKESRVYRAHTGPWPKPGQGPALRSQPCCPWRLQGLHAWSSHIIHWIYWGAGAQHCPRCPSWLWGTMGASEWDGSEEASCQMRHHTGCAARGQTREMACTLGDKGRPQMTQ